MELTGSLDGDFEFPSSGSFGVDLEVCSLLHSQAFGLQATTFGSAQAGVAGCEEATQSECLPIGGANSSTTHQVSDTVSVDRRRFESHTMEGYQKILLMYFYCHGHVTISTCKFHTFKLR